MLPGWNVWLKSSFSWSGRERLSLTSYTGGKARFSCGCGSGGLSISFSFREEAQHVWEKREAEWERERKARERLMHEVQSILLLKFDSKIWLQSNSFLISFLERFSQGGNNSSSWRCKKIVKLRRNPWRDEKNWSRGWSWRESSGSRRRSVMGPVGQPGCKR